MAGVWVGYGQDQDFYRLELDQDGTGMLIWVQSFGRSVSESPIDRWDVTDWKLSFSLAGTRRPELKVESSIAISRYYVRLRLFDRTREWEREGVLLREEDLMRLSEVAATRQATPRDWSPASQSLK